MHCVFVLHLEQVSFHTQMTLLFENHTIDLLLVVPLEIVALRPGAIQRTCINGNIVIYIYKYGNI